MVMIRTSRRGAAVLLVLLGLGSLIYLLRVMHIADEDRETAVTKGVLVQDGYLCVVPSLSTTVNPDIARQEEGEGKCFYGGASMEFDRIKPGLKRGAKVEVTYEAIPGVDVARKVDVDGKTVFADAGRKLGWKRYILHIGAGVIALIGFLMLYAYRRDP